MSIYTNQNQSTEPGLIPMPGERLKEPSFLKQWIFSQVLISMDVIGILMCIPAWLALRMWYTANTILATKQTKESFKLENKMQDNISSNPPVEPSSTPTSEVEETIDLPLSTAENVKRQSKEKLLSMWQKIKNWIIAPWIKAKDDAALSSKYGVKSVFGNKKSKIQEKINEVKDETRRAREEFVKRISVLFTRHGKNKNDGGEESGFNRKKILSTVTVILDEILNKVVNKEQPSPLEPVDDGIVAAISSRASTPSQSQSDVVGNFVNEEINADGLKPSV